MKLFFHNLFYIYLGFSCLPLVFAAPSTYSKSPCPQITFIGRDQPSLSEVQKKLVCGDHGNLDWKEVPLNQAGFFLKSFLQQEGFASPRFVIENNSLRIELQERVKISKITENGLGEILNIHKRRRIVGQPLTPSRLDGLKGWVKTELQNRGYTCPLIDITANSQSGEVHLEVKAGLQNLLEAIEEPVMVHPNPKILKRFEAFQYHEPVDLQLLNLTAGRILDENLFLNAYFDLVCDDHGHLKVSEKAVAAKPRLISLGLGVDTEQGVIGRARYKNSGIGANSSSLQFSVLASFKEQSGEALMHYYFLKPESRIHLVPRILAKRKSVQFYENVIIEGDLMPATTYDNQDFHLETRGGPTLTYEDILSGQGKTHSLYMAIATATTWITHDFEYYLSDPRSGARAELDTQSRFKGAVSSLTADRVQLNGESLWNLGSFDPPVGVLGVRGLYGTTWVPKRRLASELPPEMKFFLGGQENVRGYALEDIPNSFGFLSALYLGLELRAGDLLPYKIEPFLFVDGAMGGQKFLGFEKDIFWSPGVGTRWKSPFGVLRGSLARGLLWHRDRNTLGRPAHWQAYFSFGEEF